MNGGLRRRSAGMGPPVVCQNSADAISGVIEHPEHREIGD